MIPGVKSEDYAFTVIVQNETWDVYHFIKDGSKKKGTLAITQRENIFTIGLLRAGHLSEAQVTKILTHSMN